MNTVAHRRMADADLPFVMDNWVESFRESDFAGPIPERLYRRFYREVVRDVIYRPRVEVWIAHNPLLDDQFFGFLCLERDAFDGRTKRVMPAIHFIYVKGGLRGRGYARHMVENAQLDLSAPFLFTFRTQTGVELARAKRLGANWNQRPVRFPKTQPTET
jgi:hypothetical protein